MSIVRPFSLAIALTLTGACGASEPKSSPAPQELRSPEVKTSAERAEGYDTCVAVFRRQRECTGDYIPALVDARVRADHPAGIAAKDKEIGRDAMVGLAMEEWKDDSTDEAIDRGCTAITSDEAAGAPELIQQAEACMEESTCAAFSACAVDLVARHW
jgi:hypothetical protein